MIECKVPSVGPATSSFSVIMVICSLKIDRSQMQCTLFPRKPLKLSYTELNVYLKQKSSMSCYFHLRKSGGMFAIGH